MDESRTRVLLIEDDEDDYVLVRSLLSQIPNARYDLEWVSTFELAVDLVRQNRHDVFLLDYYLGPNTGLELLEAVGEGHRGPVILLTGMSDPSIDVRAMKAGAADYLVKEQISSDRLERSMRYSIQRSRAEESLRHNEARLEALFQLSQMSDASIEAIVAFVLEHEAKLTNSNMGWLAMSDPGGDSLTVYALDRKGLTGIMQPENVPIKTSGVFGRTIHSEEPVILNRADEICGENWTYPDCRPGLNRLMAIPVFDAGEVAAVAVVADKPEEYDASDRRQLTLLMDGMWKIIQRKRAEEALRLSEKQLRLLATQLLRAQEEERKRIAAELHDSIGSSLTAIKLNLETTMGQTMQDSPTRAALQNLINVTQHAIEESRRIMADLRPAMLDDLGIVATIGWFCRQCRSMYSNLAVNESVTVDEREVPDHAKIVIYRVMQEAVNNAVKYSGASCVDVYLQETGTGVELVVQDHGKGFEPEAVKNNFRRGMGLSSMRERVELSGGTYSLVSKPGKGTTISAFWPSE